MISMPVSKKDRPAFTTIELLIVIAILALLMTLATSAIIKFRNTGPLTATRSNLKSLKLKVDTQWAAVIAKSKTETIPPAVAGALGYPLSGPRARARFPQLKLEQAFPVSFTEVMNPPNLPAWPAYTAYLSG